MRDPYDRQQGLPCQHKGAIPHFGVTPHHKPIWSERALVVNRVNARAVELFNIAQRYRRLIEKRFGDAFAEIQLVEWIVLFLRHCHSPRSGEPFPQYGTLRSHPPSGQGALERRSRAGA
jgi:hypothetical protein